MATWRRGVAKLYVTACVLRLRARHAAAFARGGYEPLRVSGAHAEHVCAFARIGADLRCIVVAPRWYARLMRYEPAPPLGSARWGDTSIEWARGALGERCLEWFSGGRIVSRADGDASSLRVGAVLSRFPVAVLMAVDE